MLYFVLFTNQTECGAEQLYLLIISQHKYKGSQENKRTVKKVCSVEIQKTKKMVNKFGTVFHIDGFPV